MLERLSWILLEINVVPIHIRDTLITRHVQGWGGLEDAASTVPGVRPTLRMRSHRALRPVCSGSWPAEHSLGDRNASPDPVSGHILSFWLLTRKVSVPITGTSLSALLFASSATSFASYSFRPMGIRELEMRRAVSSAWAPVGSASVLHCTAQGMWSGSPQR